MISSPSHSSYGEEPTKTTDLARSARFSAREVSNIALRSAAVFPVRVYQRLVSPLLPARCIYHPSCSEYALQSIRRFGVLRGIISAVLRVFRCSGLFSGGVDPVPTRFRLRYLLSRYRRFSRR